MSIATRCSINESRPVTALGEAVTRIEHSLVIPTFNRADLLRRALQSVADSEYGDPRVAEVIVVDNNSTDRTPATCPPGCRP